MVAFSLWDMGKHGKQGNSRQGSSILSCYMPHIAAKSLHLSTPPSTAYGIILTANKNGNKRRVKVFILYAYEHKVARMNLNLSIFLACAELLEYRANEEKYIRDDQGVEYLPCFPVCEPGSKE